MPISERTPQSKAIAVGAEQTTTYYFSAMTGDFYRSGAHDALPNDAVAITADEHAQLMAQQRQGLCITANELGRPVAVGAPAPSPGELAVLARQSRDCLLVQSVDTTLADHPHSPGSQQRCERHRTLLPHQPEQAGFPLHVDWTQMPWG